MSRSTIIAGKAVILVNLEDNINKGLNTIRNKVAKLSNSLNNMGGTALRGGFLSAIVSGKVISSFTKFEDVMLFVGSKLSNFSTNIKQNKADVEDLSLTVRKLATTLGSSAVDVGTAAAALASAGFQADQIKASLRGVIELAKGTGYGLDQSAKLIANMTSTFKLFGADTSFEEKTKTVNLLVSQLIKTTNLGTVEIEDLNESLKYVSGTAEGLGIKLPVVLGFLSEMADTGLRASLAGTSLNVALLNMIKSSDKLKAAFPQFKISTDTAGNEDLVTTMHSLFEVTKKMSKIGRVAFLQDIFNIRGARAIVSSKNIEQIVKNIEQIENAAGLGTQALKQMESGVGGSFRRMLSTLGELDIAVGETLKAEFKAFNEILAETIRRVTSFATANKALTLAILVSPIALGAFAVGAFTLSFALSRLTTVISLLKTGLSGISTLTRGILGSGLAGIKELTSPSKASKARIANIQKETKLIAKLEAKQAASLAGGSSAAKVAGSKNTANLIAARGRLATLKPGSNILKALKPSALLSRYNKLGKGAKSLISGGIAGSSFLAGIPATTIKETILAIKNMAAAFKLIISPLTNYKKTIAAAITLSAKLGNALSAFKGGASFQGIKTLLGYVSQVKGGLVTGHVPNILNTTKLFKGLDLLKGGWLFKSASGILSMSFSLLKFAGAATRFAFSWNGVGLAFNLLLLFGDKIPVIANAFKALGQGFSAAFKEIGKIATYASPGIELLKVAFSAFSTGNSAIGVEAVSAAFTGIVDIIGNQLTAAWNAFMLRVSDLWKNITKIGTAVFTVFTTLFEGLGDIFGNAFEGVSSRVGGLFGGEGGPTFIQGLEGISISFNDFLAGFTSAVIKLEDFGGKFLNTIQDIATGKYTFRGLAAAGASLTVGAGKSYDGTDKVNPLLKIIEEKRIAANEKLALAFSKTNETDKEYNARLFRMEQDKQGASWNNITLGLTQKKIDEFYARVAKDFNTDRNKKGEGPVPRLGVSTPGADANAASQTAMAGMQTLVRELTDKLAAIQNQAADNLVDNQRKGNVGPQGNKDLPSINFFEKILTATVGGLMETRGDILRVQGKEQLDVQKDSLNQLKDINRNIQGLGVVG